MIKRITIVCTSNKDRSPALVNYLKEVYPNYEYLSAGINKYFCSKKDTHLITYGDILWSDLIVFAENIHLEVVTERFKATCYNGSILFNVKYFDINVPQIEKSVKYIILNCGDYTHGAVGDDYLTKAEFVLQDILKNDIN